MSGRESISGCLQDAWTNPENSNIQYLRAHLPYDGHDGADKWIRIQAGSVSEKNGISIHKKLSIPVF